MANLLRYVVDLVMDDSVRATFRADPATAVDLLADDVEGGITGDDVLACAKVARKLIGRNQESVARRLEAIDRARIRSDEDPADAATRVLRQWCDLADKPGRKATPAPAVRDDTAPAHEQPPRVFATPAPEPDPVAPAAAALVDADDFGSPAAPGEELPAAPTDAVLRAIDPEPEDDIGPTVDPDHPTVATQRAPLTTVPDAVDEPSFAVLEVVSLPKGVPDTDVPVGAIGTVIGVNRDPELSYEVEVSDDEGAPVYIGPVPASHVEPL